MPSAAVGNLTSNSRQDYPKEPLSEAVSITRTGACLSGNSGHGILVTCHLHVHTHMCITFSLCALLTVKCATYLCVSVCVCAKMVVCFQNKSLLFFKKGRVEGTTQQNFGGGADSLRTTAHRPSAQQAAIPLPSVGLDTSWLR